MDFFKKARSQVNSVVKDVKNVTQQAQQQYNTRTQQHGQASQHGHTPYHEASVRREEWSHQGSINEPAHYGQQYVSHTSPVQLAYNGGYQQAREASFQHVPTYDTPQPQISQQSQPVWSQTHQQSSIRDQQENYPASSVPYYPHDNQQTHTNVQPHQRFFHSQPTVQNHAARSSPQVDGCAAPDSKLTDSIQFYVFEPNVLAHHGKTDVSQMAFTVCSNCYHNELSSHYDLASRFVPLQRDIDASRDPDQQVSYREATCYLSFPSVRQLLYQQCIPQRSVGPFVNYSQTLISMPGCLGADNSCNSDYFRPRGVENFAICPSCFNKYVKNTAFEHHFEHRDGTPDWTWICDVAVRGWIYNALVAEMQSGQPNMDRFVHKSRELLALPPCPGEGNAIAPEGTTESVHAYTAVGGRLGNFCATCYYDNVAGTNMEQYFSHRVELGAEDIGRTVCDLASKYSKFAMKVARQRGGDYDTWIKPLPLLNTLPSCTSLRGVDEEELHGTDVQWYAMRNYPRIEVCPRCYHTAVVLFGAAHHFVPITRPLRNGIIRLCHLAVSKEPNANTGDYKTFENTLTYRGKVLRENLTHGWQADDGEFKALRLAAQDFQSFALPCTGQERGWKAINGRKWIGHFQVGANNPNDITIAMCEECWDDYVKGTSLESLLSQNMTDSANNIPEGFHCNIYSKRAKAEMEEACKQGDWSRFVSYWHERNEVKSRYDSVSDRFKQQIAMRNHEQDMQMQQATIGLMQQLNANQNAIIAGIGGSVSTAANSNYSMSYGNSTIGYHYTPGGANAAQAWHEAQNMPKPSLANFQSTGDVFRDTENMLQIYNKVRTEWLAIE